MIDRQVFWTVVVLMSVGTYLIRFAFLGMLGQRQLPPLLVRALRYTAVAILPGLVAPGVLWPTATGGHTGPARLAAALVTLLAGMVFRSMMAGIAAGAATLFLVPVILG